MPKLSLLSCLLTMPVLVSAQQTDTPRLTTKDEYRICVTDQRVMEIRKSGLEKRKATHTAAMVLLQQDSASYLRNQQHLNLKDKAGVDAYNRIVATFNVRAAALNKEQDELVRAQSTLNDLVVALNAKCGGQLVPQEVHDEVLRELGEPHAPAALRPNPSLKPSPNGKPPGPVRGALHSPQPGPGSFPSGPA